MNQSIISAPPHGPLAKTSMDDSYSKNVSWHSPTHDLKQQEQDIMNYSLIYC